MKFNEVLKNLKNYEAGKPIELVVREYGIKEDEVIKLASNENPYGLSPRAIEAIQKNAHKAHLYPDDSMYELKESLASKFKVTDKNIIIGQGSDQIIEFLISAKSNSNNAILMSNITFAMYEIYASHKGSKIYKTASNEHNLDEFLEIYNANKNEIEIIFLCLPNNPLGECLSKDEVYDFISKIDENTLIVIDGAYQEFAIFKDESKKINPRDLISKFKNTIYLGTFSKAYGLGGMRIGYGVANENIILNLYKLRPPFNVTSLSLIAANVALKDKEFVENAIISNFIEMKRYEKFAKRLEIDFIDSYTNFITFTFANSKDSTKISEELLKKGIIIRNLKSYGINAIRITIGTKEQNSRFFKVFEEIYEKVVSN